MKDFRIRSGERLTSDNVAAMRDQLEEVLLLQSEYTSANSPAMQRRGLIIRQELRDEIIPLLPELQRISGTDDLRVQGKDGMGQKTEVPWTRIYSEERSPNATAGWYLVYLFSAAGDRVYLSLNQGTTRWNGADFAPQPPRELTQRTEWARSVLKDVARSTRWTSDIALDGKRSQLGHGYELGNVLAVEYPLDSVSRESQLVDDLREGAHLLGVLYRHADEGLYVPGESPELADAELAIAQAAGRRRRGRPRLSAAERKSIELYAVGITIEYLDKLGFGVRDVGAVESYDLHATRGEDVLYVEVKGTTSSGSDIILTRNEVDLHRSKHPDNALAIVHSVRLDKTTGECSGGQLAFTQSWVLDESRLSPIAFSYSTGL